MYAVLTVLRYVRDYCFNLFCTAFYRLLNHQEMVNLQVQRVRTSCNRVKDLTRYRDDTKALFYFCYCCVTILLTTGMYWYRLCGIHCSINTSYTDKDLTWTWASTLD